MSLIVKAGTRGYTGPLSCNVVGMLRLYDRRCRPALVTQDKSIIDSDSRSGSEVNWAVYPTDIIGGKFNAAA